MRTTKVNKVIYSVALMVMAVALLIFNLPLQASETDNRIESSAKETYVFKTYLKDDAIKVSSKDGAVTLTGTVKETFHKELAKETVANLPGVKSVDNKLIVKMQAPPEYSDAWLITKVKTTLLFHRNVSGMKTEVFVKDGIVTLRGEASSLAQKDLTTEYARDVEGVKDVKNEIKVLTASTKTDKTTIGEKIDTMGESIDDASITALVKMTLMYHRSTSGLKTSVKTNAGSVTLSGEAKNAAEKDLATKLVSDVHGVKKVDNQMTIKS
jgi:hyperosmotically inducible protein